ncbi:MAG: pyruvate kinase [Steroidobacteraceae bacterium]|nr:pyruvate kinase [Steroidobacteraceae bacterium]
MPNIATDRLLERTLGTLRALRAGALALEESHAAEIEAIEPRYRDSARNLLHYLGVRQRDIRNLQQDLSSLGLSSLGVIESHALASLNAVIAILERLMGVEPAAAPAAPVDMRTGPLLLRDHARSLLGPTRRMRSARIMVTMPGEAASNEQLLVDLMRAGMDVMRINCAHDDAPAWRRMVDNLRKAERIVGRRCRIQADLAGPKLRTGSIGAVGNFVRVRPERDRMGRLVRPAQVWLTPGEAREPAPPGAVTLPLAMEWLAALAPGDTLNLTDLRGRERELTVLEQRGRSWLAEGARTAYVAQEMGVKVLRGGMVVAESTIGSLPGVVEPLRLAVGDALVLTRDDLPGQPAIHDPQGRRVQAAHIHCTLPAAFERAAPGHRVWLDDGKIGGIVRANDGSRIEVEITRAAPDGARLRAEKGINFPDTDLGLAALTDKDVADLATVVEFTDMVALSFLRTPADVIELEDRLHALGAGHLGIVLKIENAAAFQNLPRILLASLRSPPVGVMVARGDLAVEVGFERLSEVQEEILWLCEAAHVPVIWATQVLEGLAKAGAPSRAEVSDAVMSSRAECVMLNKGPRIVDTVGFLADILNRMEEHHDKRMALLRRLSVSAL